MGVCLQKEKIGTNVNIIKFKFYQLIVKKRHSIPKKGNKNK